MTGPELQKVIEKHALMSCFRAALGKDPLHVEFVPERIVETPGAAAAFKRTDHPLEMLQALYRHLCGDWGDLDPEDHAANDHALEHDERLFSVYTLSTGVRVWIITEFDRSLTTFLLPEEY